MNHILAVCDSETEYAYQLVDYFSNKKGFPFQVQMFSSENNLKEYAKNHPILVALIAQKDFSEDIKTVPVEHILILGEDCEKEIKDIKIIEKYQSCERIIKELLDWLFQEGVLGRSI